MTFFRYVIGLLLAVLVNVLFVSRIAFEVLGASTAPDDFASLKLRMPKLLEWLFSTPWWVPVLLITAMCGLSAWLLIGGTKKATKEQIESHPHIYERDVIELIANAIGNLPLSEKTVSEAIRNADSRAVTYLQSTQSRIDKLTLIVENIKKQLDQKDKKN
jgi:uncharacterized protein YneF (UPF0154 family)